MRPYLYEKFHLRNTNMSEQGDDESQQDLTEAEQMLLMSVQDPIEAQLDGDDTEREITMPPNTVASGYEPTKKTGCGILDGAKIRTAAWIIEHGSDEELVDDSKQEACPCLNDALEGPLSLTKYPRRNLELLCQFIDAEQAHPFDFTCTDPEARGEAARARWDRIWSLHRGAQSRERDSDGNPDCASQPKSGNSVDLDAVPEQVPDNVSVVISDDSPESLGDLPDSIYRSLARLNEGPDWEIVSLGELRSVSGIIDFGEDDGWVHLPDNEQVDTMKKVEEWLTQPTEALLPIGI
ncbi:hypothetical protein B0J13DRAFT_628460 [Dactylonectria estremocensis]|uniref:Uncharacterized protein n=1 Tax=Dactylonectria estremocensis TaxID=1079267 RepID=A0A9P9DPG4_9HYPO|nr:hypothetical protein B0J13DRAFT_628460 [Dactylonectria estremocensis]